MEAKDLLEIINDLMNFNNIKWENSQGVCINEARTIAGHYDGLQALIQQKDPEIIRTHCFIY